MKFNKFEYKIIVFYLLAGGLWIIFSDYVLFKIVKSADTISELQTYKGWFYVAITGVMLYYFIKKHLTKRRNLEHELKKQQDNLEIKVKSRTEALEASVKHLQETQALLVQSEKMVSLGMLTAGVAHELNNPLNYIVGAHKTISQCLDEKQELSQEELREYLSWIKIGAERSKKIVKSLNYFSRDTNNLEEVCCVNIILNDCLLMLQNRYKDRVNITKNFQEDDVLVLGNNGKLHQVFLNVLTNAIDAVQSNGHITITTSASTDEAVVTVTDNGCGMEADTLKSAIEPFFTTKAPGKGTGLGLALTQSIIHDHKGTLDLSSEPGEGTTVQIKLPKAPSAPHTQPSES